MSTQDILRVTGTHPLHSGESKLDLDQYVPLRFRTYREPLGVGYVRLGNYTTTLIEIAVEPPTQVVRGFTVTSISDVACWPSFDVSDVVQGLPTLSTPFSGGEVVDLPRDFMVATRPGHIVVFWQDIGRCRGCRLGSSCFLIADGALAGVWFRGLTEIQTELFRSHAQAAGPEGV